jgi:sugar lactone lactonase YvrE
MNRLSIVLIFLLATSADSAPAQLRATNAVRVYAGVRPLADGDSAVAYALGKPAGVVPDGDGGFFVSAGRRVYRILGDGTVRVAAGVALPRGSGFEGDGGPAVSAQLGLPTGLALDRQGNLLIADTESGRLLRVSADGVISAIPGEEAGGTLGERPIRPAFLNHPSSLAVDSAGNIFIAEPQSFRIRKLSPSGILTTLAGTDTPGFNGGAADAARAYPAGLAIDNANNLYYSDPSNERIGRITPAGSISTIPGGKLEFSPYGIALDDAGNVYTTDRFWSRVWRITPKGKAQRIAGSEEVRRAGNVKAPLHGFSGDGSRATDALLASPGALAVDTAGNVLIADAGNERMRRVTPKGIISTVAGRSTSGFSGDGGPADSAEIGRIGGIAVDRQGNLYIADAGNARLRKVTTEGIISTVAGDGKYGKSGIFRTTVGIDNIAPALTMAVTTDVEGNVFIASGEAISKVTPQGVISTVVDGLNAGFFRRPPSIECCQALAVDNQGNLYAAVSPMDGFFAIARDGTVGRPIAMHIGQVTGLFADRDGQIYAVTQTGVWKVALDGSAEALNLPPGWLAFDGRSNVFSLNRDGVVRVAPDGVTTRIAEASTAETVDSRTAGGPVVPAQFLPLSVATDPDGNLYVADGLNSRIRKITFGRN